MSGVERQVVLITDVTGDLGGHLVGASLRGGADRVYACAPHRLMAPSRRVVPMLLDADDPVSIGRLAETAADVTVLVTTTTSPTWPPVSVSGGDADALQRHLARALFPPLRVASALAATLAANGGGVIACVESVQAWINLTGAFGVAQAALWSAVNALRVELRPSGVHVLAAIGAFDEGERMSMPAAAETILAGIADRSNEVVLDEYTARVRRRLSGRLEQLYPEVEG
ncbi:hypothetical protein ACFUTX_12245 [Microbacterium sp. NPDC057407]|uniref:hypothetical protein n=1 Tax=Microbacterium sp. NPDC057407 TaxID=3346120 RepID=UPI0036707C2A